MKYKQVRKLCREFIPWWIRHLGLSTWDIEVNYMSGKLVDDEGFRTHATCQADWPHQTALICIYPKAMKTLTAYEIERTVVHELLHAFVNEMRDEGIDHEERVVSGLARAFMWVKNSGQE